MDEKQAELEWEARAGRLAAYAAWLASVLIVATFAYRIGVLPRGANNVKELLPQVKAHNGAFIVSGVLTALATLVYIVPLLYLYRVTRFRRPELPPVTRYLAIAGPVVFAICAVWFQFRQGHAADQFAAGSVKTNKHAENLLRDATTLVAALSLAASIAMGFATLMISLNAMRAGLLSRFMGVLGVILGALFVLPLIASPIIQLFWLIALGMLFIGVWPGQGRGPAWETGEAIPWPSPQRGRVPANAEVEPEEPADDESDGDGDGAAATAGQPAPRKRKKRKARR
jgi:hypothetical protein